MLKNFWTRRFSQGKCAVLCVGCNIQLSWAFVHVFATLRHWRVANKYSTKRRGTTLRHILVRRKKILLKKRVQLATTSKPLLPSCQLFLLFPFPLPSLHFRFSTTFPFPLSALRFTLSSFLFPLPSPSRSGSAVYNVRIRNTGLYLINIAAAGGNRRFPSYFDASHVTFL